MTITRGVVLALGGLAALAGCRELELPPPPGPGTVQAVVVYAHPGQYDLVPAVGARARLLRGTEAAVVEDPEGRLVLGGLGHAPPPLLITFDSDADGVDDRQRLVNLAAAGAGFGRDVFLGTLALNRNAEVTGKVKRGDRAQLAGGHGGISLYVPEAPFATTSADDGTYRLSALPEGELTIAAFVEGYEPFAQTIALRGGERLSLADIELKPNPGAPTVGALSGSAYLTDGAPAAGVTVTASQTAEAPPVVTDAQGAFSFPALTVGLWNVRFERTGLATLRVDNVLVVGGQNVLPPVVLSSGSGGGAGGGGAGGGVGGGPGGGSGGGTGGGATGGGGGGAGDGGAGGGAGGGGDDGGTGGGSGGGAGGGTGGGTGGGVGGGTGGGFTGLVTLNFVAQASGGVTGEIAFWDGGAVCSGGASSCSLMLPVGTELRLHANPTHPWATFVRWTGPASCGGAPHGGCLTTVDAPATITAEFDRPNLFFVSAETRVPASIASFGEPSTVLDAWCNDLARDAGLPGTFAAWVGYLPQDGGMAYNILNRTSAARGWIRPDGRPVFDELGTINQPNIDQPMYLPSLTQHGLPVAFSEQVATGLQGTSVGTAGHCNAFSSSATLFSGVPTMGGGRWSQAQALSSSCDQVHHFYCLGLDRSVPVLIDRTVAVRRAFLSTHPFVIGDGGIAAADAHCQADPRVDGGTFLALVPAGGLPAPSRFPPGPPWARPDGVVVVTRPMLDFITGALLAPLDNTPGVLPGTGLAFFGASGPAVGAAPCNDWASTSGIVGQAWAYATDSRWAFVANISCNVTSHRLYCFEP